MLVATYRLHVSADRTPAAPLIPRGLVYGGCGLLRVELAEIYLTGNDRYSFDASLDCGPVQPHIADL